MMDSGYIGGLPTPKTITSQRSAQGRKPRSGRAQAEGLSEEP
jgi:hypothetical protein